MEMQKLRTHAEPFLWGAVAGAVALAVVGFNWGGWMTGSTAERVAAERADAAMVASLVPICVSQFQKAPEASGRLTTLKATQSWEQGDYVIKGGWATMPGASESEPNRQVAQACAEALAKM